MWYLLIKVNPNLIRKYDGYDNYIFEIAIENGFEPDIEDLKKDNFCSSSAVMRQLIKKDYNLILNYKKNAALFYNDSVIKEAMDLGYEPNIDHIMINKDLGRCKDFIIYLFDKGYIDVIKYYINYGESFNENKRNLYVEALEKGYVPEKDHIEDNPTLGRSFDILEKLLPEYPELIKYIHIDYSNKDKINEIVEKCLEFYIPTENDLKNNKDLAGVDSVMLKLIENHPEYIKYYTGGNEEIIRNAIERENGYKVNIEDYKNKNFYALTRSDIVTNKLMDSVPNRMISTIITFYGGNNEEIFRTAIKRNYKPTIKDYKIRENFQTSDIITKYILDLDVSLIEKYKGGNPDIYKIAIEKGYDPINNISLFWSNNIVEVIVEKYPNYIEKCDFNSWSFMKALSIAISKGYKLDEEKLKTQPISSSSEVMVEIIKNNPEHIKYYTGSDEKPFYELLKKGYVFKEIDFNNSTILSNQSFMESVVIKQSELFHLYYKNAIARRENNDALKYLNDMIEQGIIPTLDMVKSEYLIYQNLKLMRKIIDFNPEYIEYYKGELSDGYIDLYITAFENGGYPNIEDFEVKFSKIKDDFDIMYYLVSKDYRFIDKVNEDLKVAINILLKNYVPEYSEIVNNKYICNNEEIIIKLLDIDYNFIKLYEGVNQEIFKKAINLGYSPSLDIFNTDRWNDKELRTVLIANSKELRKYLNELNQEQNMYFSLSHLYQIVLRDGYIPNMKEVITHKLNIADIYKEVIDKSSKEECIDYLLSPEFVLIEEQEQYIYETKNLVFLKEYIIPLKNIYKFNKMNFLDNITVFQDFLKHINVDKSLFIQYAFGKRYNWLDDMIEIINNNELEKFLFVKEFFFDKFYNASNNAIAMDNLVNLLFNYRRYKDLCIDIATNKSLDDNLKSKIEFLFIRKDVLNVNDIPKKIEDLENIEETLKNQYILKLKYLKDGSIEEIKEMLSVLLFNENLSDFKKNIDVYGSTKDLRQLMFVNRNNKDLAIYISEMMIYTSMIESIIEEDNKDNLVEIINNILDNFELATSCSMLFSNFDEKMRILYELELQSNLTKEEEVLSKDILLDKELTDKYGVEVYDFSNKDYCLLAHVKSYTETIEELALGNSSGNKNFICLSAISYRNQVYYSYNDNSLIFGYDNIPLGNFRMSSTFNMGSNGSIQANDTTIGDIDYRTQRGILEVSQSPSGNSEVLVFREGLKPKYIILPGDRVPTEEEIEIAKKYDLKFVRTQKIRTEIKNPEHIKYKEKEKKELERDLVNLETIKKRLENKKKNKRRQIAIFTDAHGLFEPTLAILEDARKNGITEIYSLGDNIGTGPNPKEVLELLDEYGVKSIKGNHEGYVFDGVSEYEGHLRETGGYDEALKNSDWTRSKLSDKDLEMISKYPDEFVIEIGGEKVLLTHYLEDVKTGKDKDVPKDIKMVFEGHKHFESETDEKSTLRGAGIGISSDIDNHSAYYIVLTEKETGGFEVEKRRVSFDYMHTYHDISLSDMNEHDKEKIESWAGLGK